jgi:hypothetical protein
MLAVIHLGIVRPESILGILELTDSFGIHREAVLIPLTTAEEGAITMQPDGRIRIVCPDSVDLDEWLVELRDRLEKIDLTRVARH